MHTSDSDATLRALLDDPSVHDVDVTAPSLEDAFHALVRVSAADTTPRRRFLMTTTLTSRDAALPGLCIPRGAQPDRLRADLPAVPGPEPAHSTAGLELLGFIISMPTLMYLFFATMFGDMPAGPGVPVAALMMIMLGAYGGLGAAMNAGSQLQAERSSGWFRQLMLTGLRPYQFVAAKVYSAVDLVIPAIGVVFVAGAVRGVRLDATTWLTCLALIVATAAHGVAGPGCRPVLQAADRDRRDHLDDDGAGHARRAT